MRAAREGSRAPPQSALAFARSSERSRARGRWTSASLAPGARTPAGGARTTPHPTLTLREAALVAVEWLALGAPADAAHGRPWVAASVAPRPAPTRAERLSRAHDVLP